MGGNLAEDMADQFHQHCLRQAPWHNRRQGLIEKKRLKWCHHGALILARGAITAPQFSFVSRRAPFFAFALRQCSTAVGSVGG